MKNRLENYDYSTCGTYFITICTLGKQNRFGKSVGATIGRPPDFDCMQNIELSPCGMIVDKAINNISSVCPALSVDCYVIMPNHIHLLLQVCTIVLFFIKKSSRREAGALSADAFFS